MKYFYSFDLDFAAWYDGSEILIYDFSGGVRMAIHDSCVCTKAGDFESWKFCQHPSSDKQNWWGRCFNYFLASSHII